MWPVFVFGTGIMALIVFALVLAITPSGKIVATPAVTHASTATPVVAQQPAVSIPPSSPSTLTTDSQQTMVTTPSNPPLTPTISSENSSNSFRVLDTSTASQANPMTSPGTTLYNYNAASDSYLKSVQPDWGKPSFDPSCPLCQQQAQQEQQQEQQQ